ncbi:MAG: hypothetical protein KatS3mg107_0821 [Gemmataceae bacterium]|jgi:hypothetical protein|nr:MAG: hypothetical protein KatS3mg107_0821 [Gemmataceae bacterium]
MSRTSEGISLVLTVTEITPYLPSLCQWQEMLNRMNLPHEIIIVSSSSNITVMEKSLQPVQGIIWIHVDEAEGVGIYLRKALPRVNYPYVLHLTLDYPYPAKDFKHMWERIHQVDDLLHRPPDIVNGCRTGLPTPRLWKILRGGWRLFWRIFSGLPHHSSYPWHGSFATVWRYLFHWIYGIPLLDPLSGCKLYRTAFLKCVPIQSNDIFVHIELSAKATFLTSIIDEVYLSPQVVQISIPKLSKLYNDCWLCFRSPLFV